MLKKPQTQTNNPERTNKKEEKNPNLYGVIQSECPVNKPEIFFFYTEDSSNFMFLISV